MSWNLAFLSNIYDKFIGFPTHRAFFSNVPLHIFVHLIASVKCAIGFSLVTIVLAIKEWISTGKNCQAAEKSYPYLWYLSLLVYHRIILACISTIKIRKFEIKWPNRPKYYVLHAKKYTGLKKVHWLEKSTPPLVLALLTNSSYGAIQPPCDCHQV